MSRLLVKPSPPDASGRVIDITPGSAGWTHVGFAVHRLDAGQETRFREIDRETCIVVLEGTVAIHAADTTYEAVGGRESVFEDRCPGAVYVPPGVSTRIVANGAAVVALCSAPGGTGGSARMIAPERIARETRGEGTNVRHVRAILPETEPAASLLIYEVITPGGHWSSYPPHKHDTDSIPDESALEETYYHLLRPRQGFAFQRVYTDDRRIDETMTVEHGDCVLVPEGYHPVGAPHGYDLYYLNVMAGPKRAWIFRNDPAHEWMLEPAAAGD